MWGESLNRENKDHKRYLKTFICYSVVRLWSFRLCGQVQHCDSTFRLLKTRPDVNSQQHADILQSWVRIRNTQKGSYQTIHLLINKKHQKLYQNKDPSLKQKSPLKSFFGDRQEKKKIMESKSAIWMRTCSESHSTNFTETWFKFRQRSSMLPFTAVFTLILIFVILKIFKLIKGTVMITIIESDTLNFGTFYLVRLRVIYILILICVPDFSYSNLLCIVIYSLFLLI